MDSNTKFNAVSGAIRPGFEVPNVPAGSVNRNWSIPRFQPKVYSLSVSKPIKQADKTGVVGI